MGGMNDSNPEEAGFELEGKKSLGKGVGALVSMAVCYC